MDELYNEVCDIIQEQYNCGDITEEDATTLMEAAYDRYVVERTNKRRMAIYKRLENDNKSEIHYSPPPLLSGIPYTIDRAESKYDLGLSGAAKKRHGEMMAKTISSDRKKRVVNAERDNAERLKIVKDSGLTNKRIIADSISRLSPSKEEARKNKKEFLKTLPVLPNSGSSNNSKKRLSDEQRVRLNELKEKYKPKKRVLHVRDASTIHKMNNTLPYKKDGKKSFTFNKPFGKMKSSKKINIK